MKLTGLVISMGVGLAAGAVPALLLPRQSPAHKLGHKAAFAVEDAADTMGEKLCEKIDMM